MVHDYPECIINTLTKLGFNSNVRGCEYIAESIMIIHNVGYNLSNDDMKRIIYGNVSRSYNCGISSVERAIRHTVNDFKHNYEKTDLVNEIFGDKIKFPHELTNFECIILLEKYLYDSIEKSLNEA